MLQIAVGQSVDRLESEIAELATLLGLMPAAIVDGSAVASLSALVIQMQVRAAESDASAARQEQAQADATSAELGAKGRTLVQEVPNSLLANPPFLKEIEQTVRDFVPSVEERASQTSLDANAARRQREVEALRQDSKVV